MIDVDVCPGVIESFLEEVTKEVLGKVNERVRLVEVVDAIFW